MLQTEADCLHPVTPANNHHGEAGTQVYLSQWSQMAIFGHEDMVPATKQSSCYFLLAISSTEWLQIQHTAKTHKLLQDTKYGVSQTWQWLHSVWKSLCKLSQGVFTPLVSLVLISWWICKLAAFTHRIVSFYTEKTPSQPKMHHHKPWQSRHSAYWPMKGNAVFWSPWFILQLAATVWALCMCMVLCRILGCKAHLTTRRHLAQTSSTHLVVGVGWRSHYVLTIN